MWKVYRESSNLTYEVTSFDTEEDAADFCERRDWVVLDENEFEWALYIEEVPIGYYTLCNLGGLEIMVIGERDVRARVVAYDEVMGTEICPRVEGTDENGEFVEGFMFGKLFVPFDECMRTNW